MGKASIPVDLVNPGQVFACLGFLEAADCLYGPAEGGFTWDNDHASFHLEAEGASDPVGRVLDFVANAEAVAVAPEGWASPKTGDGETGERLHRREGFPAAQPNESALPVCLHRAEGTPVYLGHWTDGSSRDPFKLYSGNRSALGIVRTMIGGKVAKTGKIQSLGIRQLFEERGEEITAAPFDVTVPMGGSFNFDARCAWTSIDAGYSPNDHNQQVAGSPVVEVMAAWGLEHARPSKVDRRYYRYGVWHGLLPLVLARPALAADLDVIQHRIFGFTLGLSGKNKIVEYAQEENAI